MKIEIEKIKKEMGKDKYPHIGIYEDGEVVLFVKNGHGLVLRGASNSVGKFSDIWLSNYKLFNGKITISNEE